MPVADGGGRRRAPRVAAQCLVVASIVGVTTAFAGLHKDVTLDVDGEIRSASTYGRTVADVLEDAGVEVDPADLVEPAPDDAARDGATIVVRTAQEVTLEVDGEPETITTTARTVGELLTHLGPRAEGALTEVSRSQPLGREPVRVSTLKTLHVAVDGSVIPITSPEPTVRGVLAAAGIVLGEGDTTSVPLDEPAVDGLQIEVHRAATTADVVTEVLPFETQEVEDPELPTGHRVVEQTGRVGEAVTTYAVQTVGGEEVSRTVMTQAVTSEPRDEIIRVGTLDVTEVAEEDADDAGSAGTGSAGTGSVATDSSGSGSDDAASSDVVVTTDPGSARAVARSLIAQRGWGDDQFSCLDRLWTKESNWRVDADNPTSSAYGIPQALPGSKMASAGPDWRTNAATQIRWGLGYIEGRYGTPCAAWSHSVANNWY